MNESDVERAIDRIKTWQAEWPLYEGDDPRAVHYQDNHHAADLAIAALSSMNPMRDAYQKAVMQALWPILGGDQTDAEIWHEISEAVEAAIAALQENEE